jgi:hypothetical protein
VPAEQQGAPGVLLIPGSVIARVHADGLAGATLQQVAGKEPGAGAHVQDRAGHLADDAVQRVRLGAVIPVLGGAFAQKLPFLQIQNCPPRLAFGLKR